MFFVPFIQPHGVLEPRMTLVWEGAVTSPLASGQILQQLFWADGICSEGKGHRRKVHHANVRFLPDGSEHKQCTPDFFLPAEPF